MHFPDFPDFLEKDYHMMAAMTLAYNLTILMGMGT